MIAYILTHLWVFMEMLFLDILADAFLIKKKSGSRSKRVFGLLFLTMVMSVSVTLFEDIVALKLFFDFLLVYAYLLYFYQTTLGEALSVYWCVRILLYFWNFGKYANVLPHVPDGKKYGAWERLFDPMVLEKRRECSHTFRGNTGIVSVIRNHCGGRNLCITVSDADADCACGGDGSYGWHDRTQYFSGF